jgi:ubiquitin-conjugating enzyme E2 Q
MDVHTVSKGITHITLRQDELTPVLGHGVYFSPQFSTSLGYCHFYSNHNTNNVSRSSLSIQFQGRIDTSSQTGAPLMGAWHNSALGVGCAMSLNEIVNAPGEFVSRTPHYVVATLDWIQTRYLLVKCSKVQKTTSPPTITIPIEQDPAVTPVGDTNRHIALPRSAIPRIHRPSVSKGITNSVTGTIGALFRPNKRVKIQENTSLDSDDTASIATLEEDLEPLRAGSEEGEADSAIDVCPPRTPEEPETDFIPGTLDHSTLPRFPPPENASPSATKQLLQRFMALKKVQDSKPPATLGWYVDPQQFESSPNFFQWIVELHTFDPNTPLSKDMKQAGIKSLVLEFRFPDNFPFAPPFVRVIRPRLLPFNQGGGGHVTVGGSLCMQLLTNDGWLATMDMESVLVSIRHELLDPEPHPARLDTNGRKQDYGIGEAVEGYIRACASHGWKVPPGFRESVMAIESPMPLTSASASQ